MGWRFIGEIKGKKLMQYISIFTDYSMTCKTAFLPRPSISILLGEVPENLGVVGTNLA
jgi:hypothetical protein